MVLPQYTQLCYTFQMIYNSGTKKLVLVSACDVNTVQEVEVSKLAEQNKWDHCHVFTEFPSLKAVEKASLALNPFHTAGFVVCDQNNFNRFGVLSPQYAAIQQLQKLDAMELNTIEDLITEIVMRASSGQELWESQFLENYRVWGELYMKIKDKYEAFIKKVQSVHDELLKCCNDKKEYLFHTIHNTTHCMALDSG